MLLIGESPARTFRAVSPLDGNVELKWMLDSAENVKRFLDKLLGEAKGRNMELQVCGEPDFESYAYDNFEQMPRLVVLIDDLDYVLLCLDGDDLKSLENILIQGKRLGIYVIASSKVSLSDIPLSEKSKGLFTRVWSTPLEKRLKTAIEAGDSESLNETLGDVRSSRDIAEMLLSLAKETLHPMLFEKLFEPHFYDYLGLFERGELVKLTVTNFDPSQYKWWVPPWKHHKHDEDT